MVIDEKDYKGIIVRFVSENSCFERDFDVEAAT